LDSIRYGALELAVTDQFTRRWDDRGSGASLHGAFFNPNLDTAYAQGWRYMGSLAHVGNHEDISGRRATILVRGVNAADQMTKPPVRFDLIWRDQGSGANANGAVWRPVAPAGYVALGDVWGGWDSWDAPLLEYYACIRKDFGGRSYVREATIGDLVWWDKKSGAHANVATYKIVPPAYPADSTERLILGADLHVAVGHYNTPDERVYVLDVPASVVKKDPPPVPVLTSSQAPDPRETLPVINRIVTVPCTLIADPGKTLQWQVANSPFYQLERWASYYWQMHYDNTAGSAEQPVSQNVTTGISREKSEEFSKKTGVTVEASAGISFKGLGASVSTSTTTELGYSRRYGETQFSETTQVWPMVTPPRKACALWSPRHEIRSVRKDGTIVGGGSGLVFEVDSRINTEFPAPVKTPTLPASIAGGDPRPFGPPPVDIPGQSPSPDQPATTTAEHR
jgi:hypothetical protein